MQITYTNADQIQLKTRTQPVQIGNDQVVIGDRVISGPGEYDVASIQCEAHALPLATAYFIRDEELLIAYLTNLDDEITKLDDSNDTDILILDLRSDAPIATAKSIIKAIEPTYVFVIGAGASTSFLDSLGLPKGEEHSLKITRSGLPLEGTFLITA